MKIERRWEEEKPDFLDEGGNQPLIYPYDMRQQREHIYLEDKGDIFTQWES